MTGGQESADNSITLADPEVIPIEPAEYAAAVEALARLLRPLIRQITEDSSPT